MTDRVEEADRVSGAPHPRETPILYGQKATQTQYLDAVSAGRLHHAWLITGPRGVGKATLAWHIARHLIAGGEASTLAMDPADTLFRQIAALGSPQLFLCRRPWDDKAERLRTAITIEEIRALTAFFQLSAADGGWRVALIDSADELNPSAANALLKILEEPPPRAILLLVSHRPAALLPTLRSRCRELRCAPLSASDLAAALIGAGAPTGSGSEATVAMLGGGSVGAAFRLIQEDGAALYSEIVMLLRRSPIDRRAALALAESAAGRAAAARYELVLELIGVALSRLALAASGANVAAVTDAEAELMAILAQNPAQAKLWAGMAPRLNERTRHARAVNLDPAQVILDTFLQIDAAAAEARAHAA